MVIISLLFFQIGKPHPDPVVETASMASVEPPDIWYKLKMPRDVIDEGHLSALQLESITYSCQQHDQGKILYDVCSSAHQSRCKHTG